MKLNRLVCYVLFSFVFLCYIIVAIPKQATAETYTEIWNKDTFIPKAGMVINNSLYIEPGVHVYFEQNATLIISGSLTAIGTEAQPITFTSNNTTQPGAWDSIKFTSGSSGVLKNAVIEFASQGITARTSNLQIENCVIIKTGKYGIKCEKSSPVIENNTIELNENIGVRVEGASANPVIRNNTFHENLYYGIYVDNNAESLIVNNTLISTNIGIYAQLASPIIRDNKIKSNSKGIYLRVANAFIEGNLLENNTYGIFSSYSNLSVAGNRIENNTVWGIYSGNCNLYLENNLFAGTNYIRQDRTLEIYVYDQHGPLNDVNITAVNAINEVVYSSNTGSINFLSVTLPANSTYSNKAEYYSPYIVIITKDAERYTVLVNLSKENYIVLNITTFEVTYPKNNEVVKGKIQVSGFAPENANITYCVDNGSWYYAGTGNWSFWLDTTNLKNGAHTLTVKADNRVLSMTINVNNPELSRSANLWTIIIIMFVIIALVALAFLERKNR